MPTFEEILTQENCTEEQRSAINHPDAAWVLQACPGSGKTKTAALRVGHLLQSWPDKHRGIALLSHTNVAVESFTSAFRRLGLNRAMTYPHFVGTLDSFIAKFLILPFGHIVMGCSKAPILLEGDEHFLTSSYQDRNGNTKKFATYGIKHGITGEQTPCITKFELVRDGDNFIGVPTQENKTKIKATIATACKEKALDALNSFGVKGFYTHAHAKYWALKLLKEYPKISQIIAYRFSKILVDEAQDTSDLQECILKLLSDTGVSVSLVGDPDQAIYAFAGANGSILDRFRGENQPLKLSVNFRSNNNIVQAVKDFASIQKMQSRETDAVEGQGAFVLTYPNNDEQDVITAFSESINSLNLEVFHSAILLRGNKDCRRIRGEHAQGAKTGLMPHFVKAACYRETGDIANAYKEVTLGIFNLMACPENLKRQLIKNPSDKISKQFRRLVWLYLREQLPSASLQGTTWHPRLLASLDTFLPKISTLLSIQQPDQLGRKLQNSYFQDQPMFNGLRQELRVDTIHQAKGETLEAVLFFAKRKQLQALFNTDGSDNTDGSEEKRIAYVAMTRAKRLLWVALPKDCQNPYLNLLQNKGFVHLPLTKVQTN
ncbi:MAG: ATP-dependent helicase [Cyanobacteria bacterium]|nr:ATP-dependent helicase [Cyanobacteriota bacterium]